MHQPNVKYENVHYQHLNQLKQKKCGFILHHRLVDDADEEELGQREVNEEGTTCSREEENNEISIERRWENINGLNWNQFDEEVEALRKAMDARDQAEILPVETEEEQRHRIHFLQQNRQTKVKNTHQLAQ